MADLVMVDNKKTVGADTIEIFFTAKTVGAGGLGARISAFTASNNTTASASYKAYIYNAAGGLVDPVIPQKIVVIDRFDLGPSIVSQIIPAGGTLRIENSTADSLSYYVTGKEL